MNEEIKKQMLLNSDSYEFFLKQTREAEKNFFEYSALCIKEISRANDVFEETQDESCYRRININKFTAARKAGEQFLLISQKFITEMEMMKNLAKNIFDPDLNIDEVERFELHQNYLESVDKSIDLQNKVSELIVMEMEGLRDYQENGRHDYGDDGDSGYYDDDDDDDDEWPPLGDGGRPDFENDDIDPEL